MAAFTDLPLELYRVILSYLNRFDCAACSLLCRSSRQLAQQHLFHFIMLHHTYSWRTRSRASIFLSLIRSRPRSPTSTLPFQHTQYLCLVGEPHLPPSETHVSLTVSLSDVVLVLTKLPSLRSLNFTCLRILDSDTASHSTPPPSIFSLNLLILRSVRLETSIQSNKDNQLTAGNTFRKLLNLFHSISTLHISATTVSSALMSPGLRGIRQLASSTRTLCNMFTSVQPSSPRPSTSGPARTLLSDTIRVNKLVFFEPNLTLYTMRTTDNVTLDELSVIHPAHLVYHGYASPLIQFLQIGGAFLHRLELRSCYGATLTGYQLAILRLCTQLTWLGLFPRDRIYSRYEMFAHITDIMSYLSDASLPRTLTDLVLHVNVYSASNSDNYAPEVAHCAELDQRLCALAAERGVKVVCKVIVPPRPSYARNGYVGAAESGLFVQANVHGLVQFIDGEEY